MKKNLNEEISRIKGMMGKIMTEQFDGEDETMHEGNEVMKIAQMVMDDDPNVIVVDGGPGTITFGLTGEGSLDLTYEYYIQETSYDSDYGVGDGDIIITGLQVTNMDGEIVYEGDDFTNMEFPEQMQKDMLEHHFKHNRNIDESDITEQSDYDDFEDEGDSDEDKDVIELGDDFGIWCHYYQIHVKLPYYDDEIQVDIEARDYRSQKIKVANETENEGMKVTPEMKKRIIELIKQKEADGTIRFHPYIILDTRTKKYYD